MSSQPNDEFTTAEGLKFLTFVLRAYQEESDASLSVDSDLLSEIILQESLDGMNLVILQEEGRTIVRAELSEDE